MYASRSDERSNHDAMYASPIPKGLETRLPRERLYDSEEKHKSDSAQKALTLQVIVDSLPFRLIVSAVIFSSVGFVIYESDLRAADKEIPDWLKYTTNGILLFYIVEVSIRICAYSLSFFYRFENLFDILVVVTDTVLELFEHADVFEGGSVGWLRLLRALRIIRILRAASYFQFLRELYLMLHGFVNVLRALMWATCLLSIVLTVWAIVAVDVLHPLNKDLVRDGVYPADCFNCGEAYSSVFRAILTSVKGIIAGDGWGEVALPLMTEHPWTFIIFMFMLVTVQLGLLNLILSVIVDRAIEARQCDEEHIMYNRSLAYQRTEQQLMRLCESMDTDGDGIISLDEVTNAFEHNPAFIQAVGALGIASDDVKSLFAVLDDDDSGNIDFREFIDRIHKIRCADVRVESVFIRHFTSKALPNHLGNLRDTIVHLSSAVDRIRDSMQNIANQSGVANPSDSAYASGGSSNGRVPPVHLESFVPKALPVSSSHRDATMGTRFGGAKVMGVVDPKRSNFSTLNAVQTWQKVPEFIDQSFMDFKHSVEMEFQRFKSRANDIVIQASRLSSAGGPLESISIDPFSRGQQLGNFTPPVGVSSTLLARPQFSKIHHADPRACPECGFKGCKAHGQEANAGLLTVCSTPVSCDRVAGFPTDRVVISNAPMPKPSPFAVD